MRGAPETEVFVFGGGQDPCKSGTDGFLGNTVPTEMHVRAGQGDVCTLLGTWGTLFLHTLSLCVGPGGVGLSITCS